MKVGHERHRRLKELSEAYSSASSEFHATSYWAAYEKGLFDTISRLDMHSLRSGKKPVLETFGFSDTTFKYQSKGFFLERWFLWALTAVFGNFREILPYGIKLKEIREMALHHCRLAGEISNAKPIDELSASDFGSPADLFGVNGNKYTIPFLNYYIRYCFAKKNHNFTGKEVIVELGSGSGYQVEIFRKIHPEATILCFDLPAQIYLCEEYLRGVFGDSHIVSASQTSSWTDLSNIEKGKIHCFGNWKWPVLWGFPIDIFWNAASFGEMEPGVVENYLSYILKTTSNVYLLQARHGKETKGRNSVRRPILFSDYQRMLCGFHLVSNRDAWHAHRRLSASGGYFEAWWKSAGYRDQNGGSYLEPQLN